MGPKCASVCCIGVVAPCIGCLSDQGLAVGPRWGEGTVRPLGWRGIGSVWIGGGRGLKLARHRGQIHCPKAQDEVLQKRGAMYLVTECGVLSGRQTRLFAVMGTAPITLSVYLPNPHLVQLTRPASSGTSEGSSWMNVLVVSPFICP